MVQRKGGLLLIGWREVPRQWIWQFHHFQRHYLRAFSTRYASPEWPFRTKRRNTRYEGSGHAHWGWITVVPLEWDCQNCRIHHESYSYAETQIENTIWTGHWTSTKSQSLTQNWMQGILYSLDKHIPRKKKLQEWAHLGHLLGYDSTNIFWIWVPSQRKIIRTKDVLFDEITLYNPRDPEPDLMQMIEEPMIESTVFDIPKQDSIQIVEIESDDEELTMINSDWSNTSKPVEIIRSKTPAQITHLSSPDLTDSNASSTLSTVPSESPNLETEATPTTVSLISEAPRAHEISASMDVANVLPERVTRTQHSRKEAYVAALENAVQGNQTAFHQAFSTFATASAYYLVKSSMVVNKPEVFELAVPHVHRDSLPPEPQYYHQMLKHPHAGGFKQAMTVEIAALWKKTTWKEVPYDSASKVNKKPIPTTWVFRYKFDNQGYLIKYKARLCARGDLQHINQDTFAATLAACIFWALMAIVAAFNLDTRQYDAINAFANSEIDEPTYCKPPKGWTGSDLILLLLLWALYGLKQSLALWYRNLSQKLVELGLEPVTGVDCLFINNYMLVFFFVDDIVVLFDCQHVKEVDKFKQTSSAHTKCAIWVS